MLHFVNIVFALLYPIGNHLGQHFCHNKKRCAFEQPRIGMLSYIGIGALDYPFTQSQRTLRQGALRKLVVNDELKREGNGKNTTYYRLK